MSQFDGGSFLQIAGQQAEVSSRSTGQRFQDLGHAGQNHALASSQDFGEVTKVAFLEPLSVFF